MNEPGEPKNQKLAAMLMVNIMLSLFFFSSGAFAEAVVTTIVQDIVR